MKLQIFAILAILQAILIHGQTSLSEIDLDNGNFKVGFLHYMTPDSTRTYKRIYDYSNKTMDRPISVSIWYPSDQDIDNAGQFKILDYFEILKEEEEWEHLPNEQLLNWFYYANTPANRAHLNENTTANHEMEFAPGKFPVIVYAPSFQASSIENFSLCEYLASHGYFVIASPSRGTETRWFSHNNAMEMETQARDLEFLIKEAGKFPMADLDKMATMGFSFGGLSGTLAQMRNDKIKAIVSLDGTERYNYALLQKSPFFDIDKLDVPYLHMAQKDIPENVLKEDKLNAELNTKFELYDSLSKSKAYSLKFHNLTHSNFSTLGVLFEKRDNRQDKSDSEIMESYKWVSMYTLNFLNTVLKKDGSALQFMEGTPSANGIKNGRITQRTKLPKSDGFTFQDFNNLAAKQNYKDLIALYESTIEKNSSLTLAENNLNVLGLQLVFNPNTTEQGINVFLLATRLYPNSANLLDSLAEAYLFTGDKEKAIENFERSLELNPQNQNAIDRLLQLKE
jgi:dienelactone hydrolase